MERSFHMLLYRAFHAQRSYLGRHLAEIGLGAGQPKLLTYLVRNGPCTQKTLAEYFEIDPSAVCRMLDALERNGLIVRSAAKHDRRSGLIELTDAGRAAQSAWEVRCQELEAQMLRGFTEAEQEQFSRFLNRAYRNLRGAEGEEETP
ncbi:MarR family winged helix-turn-helix transcriptional regulator [Candidatus Avoscillospira sp. LCP25S3_F1]|uniref:MarR family winged helix-turn-helix transcriptional regulator n=1 Tax=Candidatus Avoscillospira sp. LCP25S3_F1 TaxID=3438825 RepID=UPI003F923BC2